MEKRYYAFRMLKRSIIGLEMFLNQRLLNIIKTVSQGDTSIYQKIFHLGINCIRKKQRNDNGASESIDK